MSVSFRISLAGILLAGLSGCIAHQRAHSVVRCWADYNSYNQCSFCMEELDHKPLRAARVGSFIWMYDQDPGHRDAYAKARLEWEALVAQRLSEATEAANQPGVAIGGTSCEPVEASPLASDSPAMSNDHLPPLPESSSPSSQPSLPPAPSVDDGLDREAGLRGPNAPPSSPILSPRRVTPNLPTEPPGVPADNTSARLPSDYQLSGYSRATAANGAVNRSGSKSEVIRHPAGAWLFSR